MARVAPERMIHHHLANVFLFRDDSLMENAVPRKYNIGDRFSTNNSGFAIITSFIGNGWVEIQFENTLNKKNVLIGNLLSGKVLDRVKHYSTVKYSVGSIHNTKEYGPVKVLNIRDSKNVTVEFLNSGNKKVVLSGDLISGFVTDEFRYRVSEDSIDGSTQSRLY